MSYRDESKPPKLEVYTRPDGSLYSTAKDLRKVLQWIKSKVKGK